MNFAIIETGGKQYKVSVGQKIKVEKLKAEIGSNFIFDKIMLLGDSESGEAKIGTPYVADAKVEAKVIKQSRTDKKIVFKYHSKTRYRKKKGHRQPYTEVEIIKIS
jgi:large subunit ribosomal protein L21